MHYPKFEIILDAFFIGNVGTQCVGMFICVGLIVEKVKLLQLKVQGIVDAGCRYLELFILFGIFRLDFVFQQVRTVKFTIFI